MLKATRRFLIIGLGRFGSELSRKLTQLGSETLAVDRDPALVQDVAQHVTQALVLDATDEGALGTLEMEHFDAVIVSIGNDSMESSILCTALVRQLGASKVVARSWSDLHSRVLRAVGAHEVFNPEQQLGVQLAERLASPGMLHTFALGRKFRAAELRAPVNWVGQSLRSLSLRRRGLNVAAVCIIEPDGGEVWSPSPDPDRLFDPTDRVLVLGMDEHLRQLTERTR